MESRYWLTRFVFLRLLGLVYAVAFLILVNQGEALIGSDGLMPAQAYLERVAAHYGGIGASFLRLPTLFWFGASDGTLQAASWIGLVLSLLVLAGFANAPMLGALWLLYMSFVHVGQIFYGYGWEILLLETGFLAIFLAPPWRFGVFREQAPPPTVVVVLLRWLAFRLMFGAGLIKLRGDPCWRDLTCLVYHYETQPIPNPLSFYLHRLPLWFHEVEVLFNHFIELVAPWMVFGPRRLRHLAGVLLVLFQSLLIVSGNLSFLNWLTITVCVACFDDSLLARALPPRLTALPVHLKGTETSIRRGIVYGLAVLVAVLSLDPLANMLSPGQVMNTSFDPFDLVNTYGAFGSIGRERYQVILQGTHDLDPGPGARWVDYQFKCQPGDVLRRPCIVSPYHYRIDWQMWFASMTDYTNEPWLVHLIYKLLVGDPKAMGLLAESPLGAHPPRYVRAELYRYEFAHPGDPPGVWWRRTRAGEYLPALSADDPRLLDFLRMNGWRGATPP